MQNAIRIGREFGGAGEIAILGNVFSDKLIRPIHLGKPTAKKVSQRQRGISALQGLPNEDWIPGNPAPQKLSARQSLQPCARWFLRKKYLMHQNKQWAVQRVEALYQLSQSFNYPGSSRYFGGQVFR